MYIYILLDIDIDIDMKDNLSNVLGDLYASTGADIYIYTHIHVCMYVYIYVVYIYTYMSAASEMVLRLKGMTLPKDAKSKGAKPNNRALIGP